MNQRCQMAHQVSATTIKRNRALKRQQYSSTCLTRIFPSRTVRIITHPHTHTSGESAALACSEEMAVGTAVSTTQQDPSFQFPAPVSIPSSFHAEAGELGFSKERDDI